MSASSRIVSAALLLMASACASPTEVELRLYACRLAGEVPVRVDLEIRGMDAEGAALPVLEKSFDIDPAALADSYVTVGLRKPDGMVEADFVLTWHDAKGEAETTELLRQAVPAAGARMDLGAEGCAPVGESSSGTLDPSSSGTSTTDVTDGASSSSSSGDASSSSSTSIGDTEDTSGSTTGEMETVIGSKCSVDEGRYCEHGGPGQVGTLLDCLNEAWQVADLVEACDFLVTVNCVPEVGLVDPKPVGCSGIGTQQPTCVCEDAQSQQEMCEESSCGPGDKITLCKDGHTVLALCSLYCKSEPEGSVCVEKEPMPP